MTSENDCIFNIKTIGDKKGVDFYKKGKSESKFNGSYSIDKIDFQILVGKEPLIRFKSVLFNENVSIFKIDKRIETIVKKYKTTLNTMINDLVDNDIFDKTLYNDVNWRFVSTIGQKEKLEKKLDTFLDNYLLNNNINKYELKKLNLQSKYNSVTEIQIEKVSLLSTENSNKDRIRDENLKIRAEKNKETKIKLTGEQVERDALTWSQIFKTCFKYCTVPCLFLFILPAIG